MISDDKLSARAHIAEKVVAKLAVHNLPATPENFSLFHYYFLGSVSGLSEAIDAHIAAGTLTLEQCREIFTHYIAAESDTSGLQAANVILERELTKIEAILRLALKGSGQFGKDLDTFSWQLASSDTLETLHGAVEKIANETRMILAQNGRLQNDLAETTEQLRDLRDSFDRAHKESLIDPLTEVGNRKFFNREIDRLLDECGDGKTSLSVLMIDIDHFKKFNDMHGHLVGDQVLRLVARTLVENLKGRDIVARYGGEEFVILLPHTVLRDAERVGGILRTNLANKRLRRRGSNDSLGAITISIGAAEYVFGESMDSLIGRADAALYKAKQTGRNKVMCAPPPTSSELE